MKPNPFFESNHLTVPVGMTVLPDLGRMPARNAPLALAEPPRAAGARVGVPAWRGSSTDVCAALGPHAPRAYRLVPSARAAPCCARGRARSTRVFVASARPARAARGSPVGACVCAACGRIGADRSAESEVGRRDPPRRPKRGVSDAHEDNAGRGKYQSNFRFLRTSRRPRSADRLHVAAVVAPFLYSPVSFGSLM